MGKPQAESALMDRAMIYLQTKFAASFVLPVPL